MPLLSPTVNGATVGVDSTDAEDGDAPDDTDDSTFERLTGEADPERFDRTFLAQSDSFQIGGAVTSPAPFPLQVLPRVAYVINYNVVYDPDRDKWVPQHPFSDEGLLREVLDSGTSVATEPLDLDFGTDLSASASGNDPTTVTVDAASSGGGAAIGARGHATSDRATSSGAAFLPLDTETFANGMTVDTANDQLVADSDGLYSVHAQGTITGATDETFANIAIQVEGNNVTGTVYRPEQYMTSDAFDLGLHTSDVVNLQAGDTIKAFVNVSNSATVESGSDTTFIAALGVG
jgi:hypothetical protein